MGFGRACAPVRCAHPSFWAHQHAKRGAARTPARRSFAAPPKIKNYELFPDTKCFRSGPNSGRQGRIFFHWAKLHPPELRFTLLNYAGPYWATLHPTKLCWIQLSYAVPSEPSCTLLSWAAPLWATLHLSELRCTLSKLRCALRTTLLPLDKLGPSELRYSLGIQTL